MQKQKLADTAAQEIVNRAGKKSPPARDRP